LDEYNGFRKALTEAGGGDGKSSHTQSISYRVPFYACCLRDNQDRKICYEVFHASEGRVTMPTYRILKHRKPSWLFMTGVCSGKRGKVKLGDLIVADYAFPIDLNTVSFMDGRNNRDMRGIHLPQSLITTVQHFIGTCAFDKIVLETSTARPESLRHRKERFLQRLQNDEMVQEKDVRDIFDNKKLLKSATKQLQEHWVEGTTMKIQKLIQYDELNLAWILTADGKKHVAKCRAKSLGTWPCPDSNKSMIVHLGEIAVSSSNRSDMPRHWPELTKAFGGVLGLEMETHGFYTIASEDRGRCKFLMVKAVQDFADAEKDDSFRHYGCELSAAWVIKFVNEHAVDTADITVTNV